MSHNIGFITLKKNSNKSATVKSEKQSQLQTYMYNLKEMNVLCLTLGIVVFIFQIVNPKPLPDGSDSYLYGNIEIRTLNTLSITPISLHYE